jgi:hypothetical protein
MLGQVCLTTFSIHQPAARQWVGHVLIDGAEWFAMCFGMVPDKRLGTPIDIPLDIPLDTRSETAADKVLGEGKWLSQAHNVCAHSATGLGR